MQPVNDSEAVRLRPPRNGQKDRRLQEREERERHASGREVSDDMTELRFDRPAERPKRLADQHQCENSSDH